MPTQRKYDVVIYHTTVRLTGTIVKEDANVVEVKTRNGSVQTVQKALVVSIRHKSLEY